MLSQISRKCLILMVTIASLVLVGCGSAADNTVNDADNSLNSTTASVNKSEDAGKTVESGTKKLTHTVGKGETYTVHVEINPDVFFIVDDKNDVVGVIPNNSDALDVYQDIKFSSMNLEIVLSEWVSGCEKKGFDTSNIKMSVTDVDTEVTNDISAIYEQLAATYGVKEPGKLDTEAMDVRTPICEECGKGLFCEYDVCEACGHARTEVVNFNHGAEPQEEPQGGKQVQGEARQGEPRQDEPDTNPTPPCPSCGKGYIDPNTHTCPVCTFNTDTNEWASGGCIACHGRNVTVRESVCKECGGTKVATCFQCGGSGTDYVTAADGGAGWNETCSNCGGSGVWPCQFCTKHSAENEYICQDCGKSWVGQ